MKKRMDYQQMTLEELLRERDKRAVMIFGGKTLSVPQIDNAALRTEMTEILRQHLIRFLRYDDMILQGISDTDQALAA
ncbi:MAG: hypothetical protein AB7S75_19180 [Desulfococcaceae bacterium]